MSLTGRAIDLRTAAADGRSVSVVGTLEHDLGACRGQVGDPFVGSRPGDARAWALAPLPGSGASGFAFRRCSTCLDANCPALGRLACERRRCSCHCGDAEARRVG